MALQQRAAGRRASVDPLESVGEVQPVDHHQAEAVEHGGDGSMTGSAYGARQRSTTCDDEHEQREAAAVADQSCGTAPLTVRPTIA